MKIQSAAVKDELYSRLRRIEGQARGVQGMLKDDRDCHEILQQLTALQAALKNATIVFMRDYAKECLVHADEAADRALLIDDIMDMMSKTR